MEFRDLLECYLKFRPESNNFTEPCLSEDAKEHLILFLEETRNLNAIEYGKEDQRDISNLKVEKNELYTYKDSSAFELKVYLPLSKKPNLRYFVVIDDRGYHVAEIDHNYIKSGVAIDARNQERFKEIITKKFRKDLEKLLENSKN